MLVSRAFRVILISSIVFIAGFLVFVIVGGVLLYRQSYEVPGTDITQFVAGRWDWSTRLSPCRDSAHTIAFAPDKKVMTITTEYLAESDSDRVAVYDLSNVTRSSIRGAIRGETRKTDAGVPVVWDLVLTSATEYRWHRTDWNRGGFTPAIIRCDQQS